MNNQHNIHQSEPTRPNQNNMGGTAHHDSTSHNHQAGHDGQGNQNGANSQNGTMRPGGNENINGMRPENLSGTRTERNLTTAATEEARAHTKYELYSGVAYEDGYATVGDSLWNLSHQEKEHSELWYDYLGKIGDTRQNLEEAIATEGYEAESMYNEFANVADEEGFSEIAEKFRMVAAIENNHRDILKNTLTELRDGTLYGGAPDNAEWFCTNCGYVVTGPDAPDICPVCGYPKGYFLRYDVN